MREALQRKILGRLCRMCGDPRVELHHLIPRSKFSKRNKKLQDNPNNTIPLCHRHHQDHHTTSNKVPRELLLQEEIDFMNEHIHPAWIDSWYPDAQA